MLARHSHLPLNFVQTFRRIARVFLAIVLLAGFSRAAVRGEDPARELPKDGAWVRYRVEGVERQNGQEGAYTATVTVSLVGSAVEDGVPCRWRESKVVYHEPAKIARTVINKLLIPQSDILESEKPWEHVRRGWVWAKDKSAVQVPKVDDSRYRDLLLWAPGVAKSLEIAKNEAKDIEYQQGRLKNVQGRTGEFVDKGTFPKNQEWKRVTKYTVWLHPDLQFGFAETRIVTESFVDGKKMQSSSSVFSIQDAGTDAKSELPDNN